MNRNVLGIVQKVRHVRFQNQGIQICFLQKFSSFSTGQEGCLNDNHLILQKISICSSPIPLGDKEDLPGGLAHH